MSPRPNQGFAPPRAGIVVDATLVLAFAAIALGCAALWWRGQVPFPFLGTDLANISSYAAALSDPERFTGDIAIGNTENFRFYVALHVPLLMWLGPRAGDFGSAALLLLPVLIFLQTTGYYVLGRGLFSRRFPAVALAMVSLGKINLTIDYLGTYTDAEPRFLFQALLPWLLATAVRWGRSPGAWPWIMAAAGLLIYVHPVSAPSIAFATWLGLWAFRPPTTGGPLVLLRMAIAGASFLVVCLPFLWIYLGSREYGSADDYATIAEAQRRLIGPLFFDVRLYLGRMLESWTVWLVMAWGIAGAIAVTRLQRENREAIRFFVLWTAGILLRLPPSSRRYRKPTDCFPSVSI
jgi:hypothetical protein